MKKGVFITMYGINNIGKSTQVQLLAQKLKKDGHDVFVLKYPCYEIKPTGPMLNKFLRQKKNQQHISEEELQMWFTLNRYQFEPRLKKYLSQGKIVIAEDYIGTGIAWGTAKGAPEQWLLDLNQYLLQEHLSLLLIGERSFSSREKNHIHETDHSLVMKTGRELLRLAKKNRWTIIRREQTAPQTSEKIYTVVKKFLTA